MHVTVDRRAWTRGQPPESTCLQSTDGKRCIWGFILRAMGVNDKFLLNVQLPNEIADYIPPASKWILTDKSKIPISYELAAINDNNTLTEADRESQIIKRLKGTGIFIEFLN